MASRHSLPLPSTCTPIPLGLGETLPPSELILEFWGFNTVFGSSQEFPAPGTSPQPKRDHLQGGAVPKCRSIIQRGKGEGRGRWKGSGEEEGEGEEQPCFQKSVLFSFLGVLLKHSGGVFPSPAQPWDSFPHPAPHPAGAPANPNILHPLPSRKASLRHPPPLYTSLSLGNGEKKGGEMTKDSGSRGFQPAHLRSSCHRPAGRIRQGRSSGRSREC